MLITKNPIESSTAKSAVRLIGLTPRPVSQVLGTLWNLRFRTDVGRQPLHFQPIGVGFDQFVKR